MCFFLLGLHHNNRALYMLNTMVTHTATKQPAESKYPQLQTKVTERLYCIENKNPTET